MLKHINNSVLLVFPHRDLWVMVIAAIELPTDVYDDKADANGRTGIIIKKQRRQ